MAAAKRFAVRKSEKRFWFFVLALVLLRTEDEEEEDGRVTSVEGSLP